MTRPAPVLLLAAGLLALVIAARADTIRILPDQPVLACHARALHAIESGGATGVRALERLAAEAMEGFMFHVTGSFGADLDGRPHRFDVACDVSSERVGIVAMAVPALPR